MLEVRELSSGYRKKAVIHGATFDLEAGSIVALVGPNGAGKSTLVAALSGMLPAFSGQIAFRGVDVTHCTARQRVRAGLSYVAQGARVFPTLTVAECLDVAVLAKGGPDGGEPEFEQVFEMFPILAERRSQQATLLSGGERQMLAVAMALMQRPSLLMLDEPSIGLAPKVVNSLFETLFTLNRTTGITLLVAEQNIRAVTNIGARIVGLKGGVLSAHVQVSENLSEAEIRELLF